MNNVGWIKLYRSLIGCSIWSDAKMVKAWVHLILTVNHEQKMVPFDGRMEKVEMGQTITSINKLSAEWGYTWEKTKKTLEGFCDADMIDIQKIGHGLLITVKNYVKYQTVTRVRTKQRTDHETEQRTDHETDHETEQGTDRRQTRSNGIIDNDFNNDQINPKSRPAASYSWGEDE